MPKIPDSVPVKVTVSKITLEVPKSFFEQSALRAAIFIGRKGRAAATRRTKWFTLADPALVPANTRQSVALPTSHIPGSRRESMAVEAEASGKHHVEQVPVEMAVLEYSGINNVVYEVDMKPLNVFDGDWVFDQKTTHPLSVFAKILVKNRPGMRQAAGKSEQESNLNEMVQMDQDDMESETEEESDNSSNEHGEGELHGDDSSAMEMSLSGIGLTEAQLAALSGEENSNEMIMNQLRRGIDCKRRFLRFPKLIDMATIVNTKAKSADYCERLVCKSAALLGATLSFTITAELPRDKLATFEDKVRTKEDKEEMKRREKEEKLLEKECRNQEKEERKRREKEDKKAGKRKEKNYGADVTDEQNASGAKNEFSSPQAAPQPPSTPDGAKRKKSSFSPLNLVKNIFTKEEKPEKATPFAVKLTSTPYPYLVMLYDFQLGKLTKQPENYRAVHIRIGTDAASTDDFPRLLLDATKPSAKTESTITWYDGTTRQAVGFNFGAARIFFGDKAIRNVTGFDTLRALEEHERYYNEAKKDAMEGSTSQRRASDSSDIFHEQLMNVGTQFHAIAFEPTKYSTNSNQALATKYTRVTAQLIVAETVVGEVRPSDEEEKREYIRRLKKEQRQREKEERDRVKAEKEAAKAAKKAEPAKKKDGDAEAAEGSGTAPTTTTTTTTTDDNNNNNNADSKHKSNEHTPDSKEGETPSTTAAHHASPKPMIDSDEDSEAGEAEHKAGEAGEERPMFEAGATDHLDATENVLPTQDAGKKEKKEKKEKDGSKIVQSHSRSFQLSTYMINEDYVPEEGLHYHIRFVTGEELTFRARRLFLPSVCVFGDDGNKREPTLSDYLNSATE